MGRAAVLRSVHRALERNEALRTYLGHTLGASTVKAGARLVGDSVRLEELPLPVLVLGFDAGNALEPSNEVFEWTLDVLIYAEDIYQAADLLDLVEAACADHRLDPTAPQPLNLLRPGPHQRLAPDSLPERVIATRIVLTARWVS